MELLTALFPPGKGGGEGVDYGHKGKGILIDLMTDGNGMPISCCTTAANGDERQQVLPLIECIRVKTAPVGRPKKRFQVIAADKGDDAKWRKACLAQSGNTRSDSQALIPQAKTIRQANKNVCTAISAGEMFCLAPT